MPRITGTIPKPVDHRTLRLGQTFDALNEIAMPGKSTKIKLKPTTPKKPITQPKIKLSVFAITLSKNISKIVRLSFIFYTAND